MQLFSLTLIAAALATQASSRPVADANNGVGALTLAHPVLATRDAAFASAAPSPEKRSAAAQKLESRHLVPPCRWGLWC